MKKIFIIILFTLCFLPAISFAADISFSADKNSFSQNESFLVQVFLDTKNTPINAIEGTITFPPDLLELKEIRDGNSSVNFWVERPHSAGNGVVTFSGITTGGFSGPHRFLFGLVLEAKTSGNSAISFDNIQVLQNDGLGTKVPIKESSFIFSISKEGSGSLPENLKVTDTSRPEDFKPFVANDPTIFDGKYFLVFSTVDKGTGIDHYEVRENPWFFFGLFGGKYISAESPYLLQDQTLKSKIFVKAIDKSSNSRVVELPAQNKFTLFLQYLIIGIILIICIFILKKIWQRFIR